MKPEARGRFSKKILFLYIPTRSEEPFCIFVIFSYIHTHSGSVLSGFANVFGTFVLFSYIPIRSGEPFHTVVILSYIHTRSVSVLSGFANGF